MSKLFTPYNLSGLALKNRVVMAPMTRTRTMNDVPDEVVALYYAQRASAGLLITEGMPVSEEGRGYLYTPGIYNDEHVQGWRKVTQAVHAKGGRIFAQLWHVGRMSHVSLQPGHIAPVSAGTVQAVNTTVFALTESGEPGPVVPSQPRALETHEVKRITADFVHSARLAMEAGFYGVEIMAANGFIFDQFLSSELNTRTDEYGGSVENRQRFLLETIDAVAEAVGHSHVAVRLSPYEGEEQTWSAITDALGQRELAYVHLYYQPVYIKAPLPEGFRRRFRNTFKGTIIAAGGLPVISQSRLWKMMSWIWWHLVCPTSLTRIWLKECKTAGHWQKVTAPPTTASVVPRKKAIPITRSGRRNKSHTVAVL